jgi:hypothetical protein
MNPLIFEEKRKYFFNIIFFKGMLQENFGLSEQGKISYSVCLWQAFLFLCNVTLQLIVRICKLHRK